MESAEEVSVGRLAPFAVAALIPGCGAEVEEAPPTPLRERFDWDTLSPEFANYSADAT